MLFRALTLALSLSFSFPAFASDLGRYLVFSQSEISTQRSDYQGSTGALGAVQLAHYEINGDLESGREVWLAHGTIRGKVRAPVVSLYRATGRRARFDGATRYRLEAAAREMHELTFRLSSLPATAAAVRSERVVGKKHIAGLLFSAQRPVEIYDLSAEELARAGNLILEGNGSSLLLIRVRGLSANLKGMGVFVGHGLRPEQVMIHFPEARQLDLSFSGGAADPVTGTPWGIPASVLAPLAQVHFAEILVTGRLYAGGIFTANNLAGGQVNYADSYWLEISGCEKSCQDKLPAVPGKAK